MIAITLNFKSIEFARQALLDIPAHALVGTSTEEATPAPEPEVKKSVKAQKDVSTQTTAKAGDAPTKTAEEKTQPAVSAQADAPVSTAATVDYPTLQKAVFVLAGKNREAAGAVAQSFGVKTFKELTEGQWGAALEAVNAKLAELEVA